MSKKIINLGKVKARTKELRLNDTVIEHKYDDEQNWQPLVDLGEAGSSIDTVAGFSELPTDAKENDVAIVEEEEYIRTENKTVVLPIEVKLNAEDQEMPNIYSVNFKDKFGTLLDNEELKNMGAYAISTSLEFEYKYIQYMDISPELASAMIGVNHPVIMAMQSESDSENMNLYLEGVSARDFAIMQMELELEEEQWATLLGEHANDSSADNPSYGWIQLITSNEPINENSVDLYGAGIYATVIFNAEAPKFNDMLGYISVSILDANGNDLVYASTSMYGNYESHDDYDPEETAFAIKYTNLTLNNIAHGGMFEQNKDIYNPKGLFQNDNGEWVSLEEKMNTPRFVDTYADLPKTSIENGIMAVAHESVYRSEPELTTKLEMMKKYRINSVGDMSREDFDGIIEDLLPSYSPTGYADIDLALMSIDGNTEASLYLSRYFYNGTIPIYYIMMDIMNYETYKGKKIAYFTEVPSGFDTGDSIPPDVDSGESLEFYPEVGKWYWCDVVRGDKDDYSVGGIHEGFPTDLPDELLFGYGDVYWDEELYPAAASEVSTYGSDPTNYKDITSIDLKVFNFEDLSSSVTITYPAGFYRYKDNEWKHVEDVSGGNFENEDALRALTTEDIGNIQENTEKRHEHSNKSYLDQIKWDTVSNVNQNTSARHTHSNQSYLDQIDYNKMYEINQSINQRHTHNNKTYLDQINSGTIDNINQNTNSRHTHSNQSTLSKITDVHLTNINQNTNARHSHSNRTTLDNFVMRDTYLRFGEYIVLFDTRNKERLETEDLETGVVTLKKNTYIYTESSPANIRIDFDYSIGTFWFGFYATQNTTLTIPYTHGLVSWKNGVRPPLCVRSGQRYIVLKFTLGFDGILGEWFTKESASDVPLIDARLLPSDKNCNFAKVEDGELVFAPMWLYENIQSYNDIEKYISLGYKRVVGENPLVLSAQLKANDECELRFKEYDDFIIVYWIVTPKGYRMFDYINSASVRDWSQWFLEYTGENIDKFIVGKLDTSGGLSFKGMFSMSRLTTIPEIDISNIKSSDDISGIFNQCGALRTIEKLKCYHLNVSWLFSALSDVSLITLIIEGTLKVDGDVVYPAKYNLISVDSLMSIINAFEDNTGETQYIVTFGSGNLAKLTPEQIAVATNKNILLA